MSGYRQAYFHRTLQKYDSYYFGSDFGNRLGGA